MTSPFIERDSVVPELLDFLPPRLRSFAQLAAGATHPVLLYGETGSGKTYLARLIHLLGPRRCRPFLPINCASIPESLFEREMFGHVRGAFTDAKESRPGIFGAANGGTLFLDEIGELPLMMQPKLLRVLDEGTVRRVGSTKFEPVDVRIIAATNQKLRELVESGRFREDLFYRCSVLEFQLPPLRKRRSEIPALARYLLSTSICPESEVPSISESALESICRYEWPGNIRELGNVLSQAAIYSQGSTIQPEHLPQRIRTARNLIRGGPDGSRARYRAPENTDQERQAISRALQAENGNKTRAAKRLGMARSTLWAKLMQYDVE